MIMKRMANLAPRGILLFAPVFQKKRHFSEIAGGLKPAPANQVAVLFQIEPLFCKTEAFFMNKILSASNIF